ncbi:DUF2332 domain-containing protein [Paracoccus aerodenitrificans]|uniref:DUF2332 domain-containing protein n=1 Tax=Paracoccus aerodenitrificans TaxID=3017781 RepID=UPI0022F04C77|nr:DUF2332 family protein [Paracoccus aerodenitrificans]WBU62725.1 DUF2332 family protein [Paracoccus aerodenitrificans]
MNPVRAAFADQARSCRTLGSDLTGHILDLLGRELQSDQGEVARRILGWQGDVTSRGASVPLRLAGALHGLVLDHKAPQLAAAYADRDVSAGLLLDSIAGHEERILDWLDRAPQTNEVGRAATLIAGAKFALDQLAAPMKLAVKELGASAGLNLNFCDYGTDTGAEIIGRDDVLVTDCTWRGPHPGTQDLHSVSRRGVDLAPPDRNQPTRLRAYIWADQPQRLARLDAALAHAGNHPPELEQGDAAAWIEKEILSQQGVLTFIYHTVAFQYFPADTQQRVNHRLEEAGGLATRDAPLAHLSMEADDRRNGAALTLRIWDGADRVWDLGRADFHGRWIDWSPMLR